MEKSNWLLALFPRDPSMDALIFDYVSDVDVLNVEYDLSPNVLDPQYVVNASVLGT